MFNIYPTKIKEFLFLILNAKFKDSIIIKDPSTTTSDVDICVSQKGYNRIIRTLADNPINNNIFLYEIKVKRISLLVKMFFYDDRNRINELILDIRKYIGKWPHQILFDFESAYKFTEIRDNFITLNDNCQYLYFFGHFLFDKPHNNKYLETISYLNIQDDKLEDCRKDILLSPVKILSRRLFVKHIGAFSIYEIFRCYGFYLLNFPSIFVKIFEYRRGKIIQPRKLFVFCGCDGAGKTTLVENINKIFSMKNISTRIYHFNRNLGIINYKKSIGNRREITIETGKTDFIRRNATFLENNLRLLSAMDRFMGLILKMLFSGRSRIMLLDRYIIDYFLRDRIVQVRYSSIIRHCMLRLFPDPSLLFYIYASPQEIFKRKKEYGNINQIKREIGLYTRYIKLLKGLNVVTIQNSDLEKSTHIIIKEILSSQNHFIQSSIKNSRLLSQRSKNDIFKK